MNKLFEHFKFVVGQIQVGDSGEKRERRERCDEIVAQIERLKQRQIGHIELRKQIGRKIEMRHLRWHIRGRREEVRRDVELLGVLGQIRQNRQA